MEIKDKRKVVIALSKFNKGGAEKNIYFLISKLCLHDFEIILVLFNGDNIGYKLPSKIRLVNLRCGLLAGTPKFINFIRKTKPDVVFTTVSYFNIYFSILRLFFLKNIYCIAREANILSMLNRDEGFIKGYIFGNIIAKFFYKRGFDLYIAQTDKMKDDMIKNFGIPYSRIHTIGNPLYSENFLHADIKKIYSNESRVYRFISVGRLHPQKGIERILKSLSRLNEDFIFDIYGVGPLEEVLKSKSSELKIDDKVFFKGFKDDIMNLLPDYDLFLLGSYYEGFPNVVLECGMAGLPVFSFYCSGCLDGILLDGVNGFIEKSDSIEEYSRHLISVSNHNWNFTQMRDLIEEKFSTEVIFSKYKQLLDS